MEFEYINFFKPLFEIVFMGLVIEKKANVAESNVTYVGITNFYGRPQFVLVDSEEGKNLKMKFPGLRFRAPINGKSLEDSAIERFEQQTGLKIRESLGLRFISPTRAVGSLQGNFRNVFYGLVDNASINDFKTDGRNVYVMDVGNRRLQRNQIYFLGDSGKKRDIEWITQDNEFILRNSEGFMNKFDFNKLDSDWFRKIPCPAVPALKSDYEVPLGCGMAVSSMILIRHKHPYGEINIVQVHLKDDEFPGYAGGKVERLVSKDSRNLDPVSCCIEEGIQEFGFPIRPSALVCVSSTGLDVPKGDSERYYNSIVNYTFLAEAINSDELEDALKNPKNYLKGKHESYVVETEMEHRDRIRRKEMRMPNMVCAGEIYFEGTPGTRVPLTQIVSSGIF